MDAGKSLVSSLEIIKMLYETAETYRKLEKINKNILNEFTLLISLKEQIQNSRRTENNPIIDNYLIDINRKLIKFQNIVKDIENKNFLQKIVYTKKIDKIQKEISISIKKLKFLLDIKKDLQDSSKLDVANIIKDPLALKFWENNFGSDKLIVLSNLFFSSLRLNTSLLSSEIKFIEKFINSDKDEYISAFEFQEWLDYFGDFSVVIQRTIDSLFDPNTQDIVDWFQQNVTKTLVPVLLQNHIFIIRKHTHQKSVFIANFIFNYQLCNLYIINHKNEFVIEKSNQMNTYEFMFYESIDKKKSPNLKEIASQLQYILKPSAEPIQEWNEQRKNEEDQNVSFFSNVTNKITSSISGIGDFVSSNINDVIESKFNPTNLFCINR